MPHPILLSRISPELFLTPRAPKVSPVPLQAGSEWAPKAKGKKQGSDPEGKKPLENPPENLPETKFLFYDMSKLPIFLPFPV